MLRRRGGAGELSPACGAAPGQLGRNDLPSPRCPTGTEMEGEAARGASQGRAIASKAVGCCRLPRALHTYPVQRSRASQGT